MGAGAALEAEVEGGEGGEGGEAGGGTLASLMMRKSPDEGNLCGGEGGPGWQEWDGVRRGEGMCCLHSESGKENGEQDGEERRGGGKDVIGREGSLMRVDGQDTRASCS